jgi:hypothetical protein
MANLIAEQDCPACGGLLVQPRVSRRRNIPRGTDYVCLKCELPCRWFGNPPRLIPISLVVSDDEDD